MNNKGTLKLFYLFLVPIVLAFIFECLYKGLDWNNFYNLVENTLFALLLISPLYFILSLKWNRSYAVVAYIFFSFCTFFESGYYYMFGTYFSPSAVFVLLDTNLDEAKEFIGFYIDTPLMVFTLVFWMVVVLLTVRYKWVLFPDFHRIRRNTVFTISTMFAIMIFLKFTTLIVFNFPYLIIKSNMEYYAESKKIGNYKENKLGNFQEVFRPHSDKDELYVIIIGESTNRTHLGLYGYYRQTTPELEKLKDELLIYDDVISPHAYSIGALTKILTLANYEFPDKSADGSIIQLINSAGFDTYWLSNQRPIGPYESLITKIALSSKFHKFITTTIAGRSKVLDGELIEEFNDVLTKLESKKNVIFIHMMGTHHEYENRYPPDFDKFNDKPLTKFPSEESTKKINDFDNAILYNDALIAEVIAKVGELNQKSFVLFFSDHGEEMYDNLDMAGHNEDIYSKQMFEVPFLLWESPKYKEEKNIDFVKDRKYMLDDLFYSVADLLDINSVETDMTRSIFSRNFEERKRIIKDTLIFDTFFAK